MNPKPSKPSSDGRDSRGRFSRGNRAGKGNPRASVVQRWRAALCESVTVGDIRAVVRELVRAARGGEAWAIREILDRCVGKPASFEQIELAERLDALEERIGE